MMQTGNSKRIIALLAAFAVVFVMLFSASFIAENIHHDCAGDDCPICTVMIQCSNHLRSIGTVLTVVAAVAGFLVVEKELSQNTPEDLSAVSLISQKVRMNN